MVVNVMRNGEPSQQEFFIRHSRQSFTMFGEVKVK